MHSPSIAFFRGGESAEATTGIDTFATPPAALVFFAEGAVSTLLLSPPPPPPLPPPPPPPLAVVIATGAGSGVEEGEEFSVRTTFFVVHGAE